MWSLRIRKMLWEEKKGLFKFISKLHSKIKNLKFWRQANYGCLENYFKVLRSYLPWYVNTEHISLCRCRNKVVNDKE